MSVDIKSFLIPLLILTENLKKSLLSSVSPGVCKLCKISLKFKKYRYFQPYFPEQLIFQVKLNYTQTTEKIKSFATFCG